MKTENAITQARQKVEAGLLAERTYCVALTKAKHQPTGDVCVLLDAANKTFKSARLAVVNLHKRLGLQVPKMKTIFMVEIYLNKLEKQL